MPIIYRRAAGLIDAWRAGQLLAGLDRYYPEIEDWYVNKAIPGIVTGQDPLWLAEDDGRLIGLALGRQRRSPKLACVRVMPSHANRGIALHLLDRSLKSLGCDRPQVTVAEELFHDWSRIFVNRYGFQLGQVHRHLYRRGKLEYEFNPQDQSLSTPSPY